MPVSSASVGATIATSYVEVHHASTSPLAYGVKADDGRAGTYPLPGSGGGAVTIDPNNSKTFTWTSTYPVDAVIVQGGYQSPTCTATRTPSATPTSTRR